MLETEVNCPFCGEDFTILVDPSEDSQSYVEDCFVCCRPIQFTLSCVDGELIRIDADRGA